MRTEIPKGMQPHVAETEDYTLKVWIGSQSIEGEMIYHRHSPKLRARFHRDSYDFQCTAGCDAWTAEQGWRPLTKVQIETLLIFPWSYAHGTANHTGKWPQLVFAATTDLWNLYSEAERIFA